MIFNFIRYTQPGWQFNILPAIDGKFPSCYFLGSDFHGEGIDERFESESARMAELGYRLWNKGVLLQADGKAIAKMQSLTAPTLSDEYLFLKKYWGAAWCIYALVIRVISFKNPVRELIAFIKSKNVQRVSAYVNPVDYHDYQDYSSALAYSDRLVAIIIPTLNRYEHLKDALHDLEQQTYSNFEVIVVDQSDQFNEAFYKNFRLKIKVITQKEKLLWTARNRAVKNTESDFLLFFDDDSRVAPRWIEEHLKCLDYFNADISAGVSLATVGQKISPSYGYFRWADQFDSGNAMVRRNVMEQIGMFDEQFNGQRMGDAEFGIRAYLKGLRSISNPKAYRIHLKVSSGGLRDMGHWDGFRPIKWFAPKPVPSVVYLYKKYYPGFLWKNAILTGIILSNVPYRYKKYRHMLILSVFLSVLKSPLLLMQYFRSLKIANQMLKNDSGVEVLQKRLVTSDNL